MSRWLFYIIMETRELSRSLFSRLFLFVIAIVLQKVGSQCLDGYFFNALSQCQKCPSSCHTCSSLTICTSCEPNAALQPSGQCKCVSSTPFSTAVMYMDPDTGACHECHYTCASCNGPYSTNCLSCKVGATLSGGPPGQCIPPVGSFIDSDGSVKPCFTTCATCINGQQTGCLTCFSGATLVTIPTVPGGECKCLTAGTGFQTTPTKGCVSCDPTCATCSGPANTQCITCKPNADLSITSQCLCRSGYSWSSLSGQCVAITGCHPTCSTCLVSSSISGCLTCNANSQLTENMMCSCDNKYYTDGAGVCTGCHPSCATCTNQNLYTSCTSCITPPALNFKLPWPTPTGTCGCSTGNSLSSDFSTCVTCNSACRECDILNNNKCNSCRTAVIGSFSTAFKIFDSSGICRCPHEIYITTTSSSSCEYSYCPNLECGICKWSPFYNIANAASTALSSTAIWISSCDAVDCLNYAWFSSYDCVCIEGTYPSMGMCLACHFTCARCAVVSSTFTCQLCKNPNTMRVSTTAVSSCVCSFPNYFLDYLTGYCTPCHYTCKSCFGPDSTHCSSCGTGSTLSGGVCSQPSMVASGSITCHANCLTCSGTAIDQCVTCKPGMLLLPNRQCACPLGFYNNAGVCTACNPSCMACSGSLATQCTLCHPTKYLDAFTNSCLCLSATDPFTFNAMNSINPMVCSSVYFTCQSSVYWLTDYNTCLSCKANSNSFDSTTDVISGTYTINQCQCNYGFYMGSNGNCQTCHPLCPDCFAAGVFACLAGDPSKTDLVYHPDAKTSVCVNSNHYLDFSLVACFPCHSSCVTCRGPLSSDCLTCGTSQWVDNGVCKCLPGFAFDSTNNCQPCHVNCVQCTQPGDSNMCDPAAQRSYETCVVGSGCTCNTGLTRIWDGTCQSIMCSSLPKCLTCSSTQCLTCFAEATLIAGNCICNSGFGLNVGIGSGNRCIPCHIKCSSCNPSDYATCTTCRSTDSAVTFGPAGGCACKDFYFMEVISGNCRSCHGNCRACKGPTYMDCLTCKQTSFTPISGVCGQPAIRYTADTQYMPDYGKYATCAGLCATCSGKSTNCLSCYSGFSSSLGGTQVTENTCQCINGKYQVPGTNFCRAVTCKLQCAPGKCREKGGVFCTSCRSTDLALLNGKCYCVDPAKGEDVDAAGEGLGTCSVCHSTCQTCSRSNSNMHCTSCGAGAVLSESPGICNCVPGYQFIGSGPDCSIISSGSYYRCHQNCQTCTGPLKTDCTSCKTSASLVASECQCASGFFMDGAGNCQPCFYTCSTCTSGLINGCTTCQAGLTRMMSGTLAGECRKVIDRSVSPVRCHPTCQSCVGPRYDFCVSCRLSSTAGVDSGVLDNNNLPSRCTCLQTNYYISINDGLCYPCHNTCATCTGSSSQECLTCYKTTTTALLITPNGQSECACPVNSMRDTNGKDCIPVTCHGTCATCRGPANTDCLTCKPGLLFVFGDKCVCPFGTYLNSVTFTCITCSPACASCTAGLATSCTTCKPTYYLDPDGSCKCPLGTIYSAGSCTPVSSSACYPSCLTCTTTLPTGCVTCPTNFYQAPDGSCQCNSAGLLSTSTTPYTCTICNIACVGCTGPANTECITCKPNSAVVSGQCVCMMGYAMDPATGNCVPCPAACTTCSSPTVCLSCATGATLSVGVCVATAPMTIDPTTGLPSQPGCSTGCQLCSSPTVCTQCKPHATLQPDKSCVCDAGYKSNSTLDCELIACDPSCSACAGPSNLDCTSCRGMTNLLTSLPTPTTGACTCPLGQAFDSMGVCKPCDQTCKICTTIQANGCVSCATSFLVLYPDNTCRCPPGQYLDPVTSTCLVCNPACVTCSAGLDTNCVTCFSPATLQTRADGQTVCTCPAGMAMLPSSGQCSAASCDPSCASCSGPSPNQCITCISSAFLTPANTCLCKDGSPVSATGTCPPSLCSPTCNTCSGSSSSSCTSCPSGMTLQVSGQCTCDAGTYLDSATSKCLPCHLTCATCSGGAANQCTSCLGSSVALSPSPVGSCTCTGGKTMGPSGYCGLCPPICQSCDSTNNCNTCWPNAILFAGKCLCQDGTYLDKWGKCQPCNSLCQECVGPAEKDCMPCKAPMTLKWGKCVCPDPTTFYFSGGCNKCGAGLHCMTCDSFTTCTSCEQDYVLDVKTKRCPHGPYLDAFPYSVEIVHDQLFMQIDVTEDPALADKKREYLESIVNDGLVVMKKADDPTEFRRAKLPCSITWTHIPHSPFEWERGLTRFRLRYEEDCQGFMALIAVQTSLLPPKEILKDSARGAKRDSRVLEASEMSSDPKRYLVPTGLQISGEDEGRWLFAFHIVYSISIIVILYAVLVRPFISRLRGKPETFWPVHYCMWFQLIALFGFVSVEFRGSLDNIYFAVSAASLRYFSFSGELLNFFSDLDAYRNGYYVGKYTGKNLTPYLMQMLFFPVAAYLLLWMCSMILRCEKVKRVVVSMRTAVGMGFGVQMMFLCGINWMAFFCTAKYNGVTITGFVVSVLVFCLLWWEVGSHKTLEKQNKTRTNHDLSTHPISTTDPPMNLCKESKYNLSFDIYEYLSNSKLMASQHSGQDSSYDTESKHPRQNIYLSQSAIPSASKTIFKSTLLKRLHSKWRILGEAELLLVIGFLIGILGRFRTATGVILPLPTLLLLFAVVMPKQQLRLFRGLQGVLYLLLTLATMGAAFLPRDLSPSLASILSKFMLTVYLLNIGCCLITLIARIGIIIANARKIIGEGAGEEEAVAEGDVNDSHINLNNYDTNKNNFSSQGASTQVGDGSKKGILSSQKAPEYFVLRKFEEVYDSGSLHNSSPEETKQRENIGHQEFIQEEPHTHQVSNFREVKPFNIEASTENLHNAQVEHISLNVSDNYESKSVNFEEQSFNDRGSKYNPQQ
jgi:hypothetical protein